MTNEELLKLWGEVRPFAYKRAIRWAAALGERSGATVEDLLQVAFLALVEAVEGYDPSSGVFLTWYGLKLKAAFTEATGQRTKRQREDPLLTALSLDAPLTDDTGDPFTLADTIEDPAALEPLENLGRREAVENALRTLPPELEEAIRARYCREETGVDTKLLAHALRLLRHPSVSRKLMEYW